LDTKIPRNPKESQPKQDPKVPKIWDLSTQKFQKPEKFSQKKKFGFLGIFVSQPNFLGTIALALGQIPNFWVKFGENVDFWVYWFKI
jgi:hypothetical protein